MISEKEWGQFFYVFEESKLLHFLMYAQLSYRVLFSILFFFLSMQSGWELIFTSLSSEIWRQ